MINFFDETLEFIVQSGHKEEDVMFIGSADGRYRMNWEKFKEKANFFYDCGFGASEIAVDLIVYFNDGTYMDRGEYDGSEWWQYHGLLNFSEEDEYKDFNILGGSEYMWNSVEMMNNKSDF